MPSLLALCSATVLFVMLVLVDFLKNLSIQGCLGSTILLNKVKQLQYKIEISVYGMIKGFGIEINTHAVQVWMAVPDNT